MRTLQEIQPGMTLGRYEFLVPIAEGGMAAVWAARLKGSRGFSKTVALKTMLPSVSDDPQFEQMFLDEAQIASRIRHPNVAEILDLGEENEVLYLVMEWVDGEPLANVRRAAAKRGGFPRSIAVRIVADACAGLHAAHELKDDRGHLVGLVHRDISPQNLLVAFDGAVKIVDFGVAKAAGRSSEATTAGQVKGKPPYMSPEQALGEVVDRRTDVFALGIILYQLTTGKHPFRGESDLVTLQNIVSDKKIVPPRAYQKNYPRALDAVVMRALNRDRDKRFQSCADFEAALEEVHSGELARAKTEDVGQFVTAMLGDKGEERRVALRQAIAHADDRAAGRPSPLAHSEFSRTLAREELRTTPTPNSTVSASVQFSAVDEDESAEVDSERGSATGPSTPYDATIPPTGRSRSRGLAWFGVAAIGLVGIGGAYAWRDNFTGQAMPAVAASSPSVPPLSTAKDQEQDDSLDADESWVEPAASVQVVADEPPAKPATTGLTRRKSWRPKKKRATPRLPESSSGERASPPATAEGKAQRSFVPPPMTDPGF